jgi:prefoldin beta subunit
MAEDKKCDDCDCGHDHNAAEHLSFDEDTQQKIQELQILEQNFQQLLMQKQAFKYELDETNFALEELKKAEGDIFRVIGGNIMIKSSKEKVEADLIHKKELIQLRTKTMDKQEEEFSSRIEKIREEVLKKISEKGN